MKNLKYIFVVLFLTGIINVSLYGQDKVGTTAAPFLGIKIGAAASAMGGAYVSVINDASSLYWNPGAVAWIEKSEITFANTAWLLGTDYNWGAIVIKTGNSAIGFQIAYLDYGQEEVTTVDQQDGTGQFWEAHDLFFSATYASRLTDRFSIGGSFKLIQQQIFNESASGFAFDIGLLYITEFNGLRLGMSISNFGTDMQLDGKDLFHTYDQDPGSDGNNPTITSKLKTESWAIPLIFRVGVSMDVITFDERNILTVATDAYVPSDNSTALNTGLQYNFDNLFFLRGGVQSIGREDIEEGLTFGVGFKYNVPSLALVKLDYAFNEYGILGDIHTIGFGFTF